MQVFINYLRAIATVLITNSHYSKIWPISALASGGLLGNILFFAASGFCLFNIKENFVKWYGKRILRIYPVMIAFTLLTVCIGDYPLRSWTHARHLFLFPTNYTFIVWLMLAYIAFYIVAWVSKKYDRCTEISLSIVVVAWLVVYFVWIDKSVYCIDNVEKPFILFLYFASMLMGALFKKHKQRFSKVKQADIVFLFVSIIVYFGSKVIFSKVQKVVFWQILNQFTILIVLYFTFVVFLGLEERLKRLPSWVNCIVEYLAKITLHIYIVQFVLIRRLEGLMFPLNFVLTTLAILAAASVLYLVEHYIRKGVLYFVDKTKGKKQNAESND